MDRQLERIVLSWHLFKIFIYIIIKPVFLLIAMICDLNAFQPRQIIDKVEYVSNLFG